jgi:hypothetical protein
MPMTQNPTHLEAHKGSSTTSGLMPPRSLFRVASVTFDRDDRVAAAIAVASGACLDFVLSAAPGVMADGGSPATFTIARADILRLTRAAAADPCQAASGPVRHSLHGLTEGEAG